MTENYPLLRQLHIGCALLSVGLFILRGALMVNASARLETRVLKVLPHIVDTVLLGSAIVLSITVQQYPFVHAWLTVKVYLLIAYIVLGSIALRYGRTLRIRVFALFSALLVVGYLLSVARWHDPLGVFALPR